MNDSLRKYIAVTALIVSVLASVFQFHTHDCGGHVRIDCNGHEFLLGCMHHDNSCAITCNNSSEGSARHNHSNNDCPLHLQSQFLCPERHNSEDSDNLNCISTAADIQPDIADLAACLDYTIIIPPPTRASHSKALFLYSSPLRGSPSII